MGFFLALGIGLGAGIGAGALVGRMLAIRTFENRMKNVATIEGGVGPAALSAAPQERGSSLSDDDIGFRDRGLGGPPAAPPPQQGYGQYGGYQQPPPPPGSYGGDGSYRPPPPM